MVSTKAAGVLCGAPLLSDVLTEVFELGPLDSDSLYTKPEKGDVKDLECGCNTVIYRSVHLVFSSCPSD